MHSPLYESRSFAFVRGSLILLMVPLVGCVLGAKKQAAAPPPPKPAVVQPPAPEQPLSIPQTAVNLPSPQPLNPDALPEVPIAQQPPAPEKTAPPAVRTARHTPAAPPKTETEPDPEPESPPATVVPEQAPPIQPILSGDELKRIQGDIESRKKEIKEKLSHVKGNLSKHDQDLLDRIQSFLAQCEEAAVRGDYTQANSLSERAYVLANELHPE